MYRREGRRQGWGEERKKKKPPKPFRKYRPQRTRVTLSEPSVYGTDFCPNNILLSHNVLYECILYE